MLPKVISKQITVFAKEVSKLYNEFVENDGGLIEQVSVECTNSLNCLAWNFLFA